LSLTLANNHICLRVVYECEFSANGCCVVALCCQETTAHEVVMLALREFGSNESSWSVDLISE